MEILTLDQRAFLAAARSVTLATLASDGRPRLVPICFAPGQHDASGRPVLYTPLDEKRKSTQDVRRMARVQDILARPEVSLLVDRWDEDWSKLAWLRLSGTAELLEPLPPDDGEHAAAIVLLRARYPQYAMHALESRPMLRIRVDRTLGWEATPRS